MKSVSTIPLHFRDVSFAYGRTQVLEHFELQLNPGEVTLLAAPNGKGKTTALWLAAGLLRPQSGAVSVLGSDPFQERTVLGRVGFLAEGVPLPGHWTGHQVLRFQQDTFPQWDAAEAVRLQEVLGFDPSRKVRELSRGDRGKLGITAVLCTRPELLLLDEPTLGLDIVTRRQVSSEILRRLAGGGCTVLIAGHEIAEAERVADRFVLLHDRTLACYEGVAELLERHRIVAWDAGLAAPPSALDVVLLPDRMGPRALCRRWDAQLASPWLKAGGREIPADLETIYLSMVGGLSHA